MKHVTLRIDDKVSELIDALSHGAGMTRSAWINRAIMDALGSRMDEVRDTPEGEGLATDRISVRIPKTEIATIESVAKKAGLSRHEWLKRTIRWQLWTRGGSLRLVPSSNRQLQQIAKQIRALGYSLNQAVKAMNVAAKPDAPLEIVQTAQHVLALRDDIQDMLEGVDRQVRHATMGEVSYWTQRPSVQPSGEVQ